MINNPSIASIPPLLIQSAYNASKAAASMFTAGLRLEWDAFGIKVDDLKPGSVKINFASTDSHILPSNPYYNAGKEAIEKCIIGEWLSESGMDRHDLMMVRIGKS